MGVLAGKRKRGEQVDHQHVRDSLWEQDSLEAHNELLFGCLNGELETLQQRKPQYDVARRLSAGSDSCWSYSGSDSGSETGLEVSTEPLALEGAVVVVTQGGEEEGAARGLAGKMKRGDELAHQPVRHSPWEQCPLEAHNKLLFGCLDGEVEALQQRKVVYDEARRLSDGSDSCWSYSDSDSGSEAELAVGSVPPALEGVVVVAAQGGEMMGEGQGPLQPDGGAPTVLGKRMQRVESSMHPWVLAPKMMRGEVRGQNGQGKQQPRGGGRRQGGTGGRRQSNDTWSMPGFSVDPGGAVLVAGRYTTKAVQAQVI